MGGSCLDATSTWKVDVEASRSATILHPAIKINDTTVNGGKGEFSICRVFHDKELTTRTECSGAKHEVRSPFKGGCCDVLNFQLDV